MKKNPTFAAILFAALLLSPALAGCGAQTASAAARQIISTPQEALSAGADSTSITVRQEEETKALPVTGETLPISEAPASVENTYIADTEAKKIAFSHAQVEEADISGLKVKLKQADDYHSMVYEVEFYMVRESSGMEYDYTIDAVSGNILEYDNERKDSGQPSSVSSQTVVAHHDESHDAESHHLAGSQSASASSSASLSQDEAVSLALQQVPGAAQEHVKEAKQDKEDGRMVYEIEILYSGMEYEFRIDAATGQLLESEAHRD